MAPKRPNPFSRMLTFLRTRTPRIGRRGPAPAPAPVPGPTAPVAPRNTASPAPSQDSRRFIHVDSVDRVSLRRSLEVSQKDGRLADRLGISIGEASKLSMDNVMDRFFKSLEKPSANASLPSSPRQSVARLPGPPRRRALIVSDVANERLPCCLFFKIKIGCTYPTFHSESKAASTASAAPSGRASTTTGRASTTTTGSSGSSSFDYRLNSCVTDAWHMWQFVCKLVTFCRMSSADEKQRPSVMKRKIS